MASRWQCPQTSRGQLEEKRTSDVLDLDCSIGWKSRMSKKRKTTWFFNPWLSRGANPIYQCKHIWCLTSCLWQRLVTRPHWCHRCWWVKCWRSSRRITPDCFRRSLSTRCNRKIITVKQLSSSPVHQYKTVWEKWNRIHLISWFQDES